MTGYLAPHPVHNEDFAHVEFLLELLGSDGHRVEEAETPVDKQEGHMCLSAYHQRINIKQPPYGLLEHLKQVMWVLIEHRFGESQHG